MGDLVSRLTEVLRKRRRCIVVAGDVMVDRWVHGHVDQCQDGCPKFVQRRTVETPGGAANAARSLEGWDARVYLYGFVDNDRPVKTRYVDPEGKIVLRADNDGNSERRTMTYRWSRNQALEMVRHADAVLLSDYDKGYLTPQFIHDVADLCATRGIPCVADCKREPDLYVGCILKGNRDWLIRNEVTSTDLVMTNGSAPPSVWQRGQVQDASDMLKLPGVNCVNHVGAGDCFAAHLTLALACGFSLKEAAALAHSAGRVYVQYQHNRPPLPSEIRDDTGVHVTIAT